MYHVFQNMGMHTKMPFYDKYWKKKYMILGYKNRQSVAMAAILNKKFSAEIVGDFSPGYYLGIRVTFLNISAFYIFVQDEP